MPQNLSFRLRAVCAVSLLAVMSGCATLPSSGPTGRQVEQSAHSRSASIRFDVVDLDAKSIRELAATPQGSDAQAFAALAQEGRVDVIAPGDDLQITVYEVGMTLFGGTAAFSGSAAPSMAGASVAAPKALGMITVAGDGTIRLPYMAASRSKGVPPMRCSA